MIPDFKTYLSESVWGDIRKKSIGQEKRIEDDVDNMDAESFYAYIKGLYKPVNTKFEIFLFSTTELNIPVFEFTLGTRSSDFVFYDCKQKKLYVHLGFGNHDSKFEKKLDRQYVLKNEHIFSDDYTVIYPRDGKTTNSFLIEFLDFILKEAGPFYDKVLVKNDGVNESIWGDIRKKSLGQEVREEDNVNNLDEKALVDYINRHYETVTKNQTFVIVDINKRITVRLYYLLDSAMMKTGDYMHLEYEPQKNLVYISQHSKVYDYPLFEKLCKKFDVKRKAYPKRFSNDTTISPKEGEVSNRFFLDVIDFFLDHAEHPFYRAIIKKDEVNESVWGDIRKKSLGQETRIENDIDLITDRKVFCEYLKERYKVINGGDEIFCGDYADYVGVPVFAKPNQYFYLYMYEFNHKQRYITIGYNIINQATDLYRLIYDNYSLDTLKSFNGNPEYLVIAPKDKSKTTNTFFLEVLDLLLDNVGTSYKKLLIKKEVNESVWGDLRKKSLGQEERMENNVNDLDFKELFAYLKEKYGNLTYKMDWEPIFGDGWNICTVYINEDLEVDFRYPNDRKKKKEIYVMWEKSTISDEFVNKLGELFNVYDYRERSYLDIHPKEGPCENKTYVDTIEFFIANKKIMCVR